MLSALLDRARRDEALWLPELREAFRGDPDARPVFLRLTLHDGTRRDFPCALPRWESEEEHGFVAEFLYACVYNILAVYSGREMRLYFDSADPALCALYDSLDAVFQLRAEKRRGYGKVISIAGRIAASDGGGAFRFTRADLAEYAPLPERPTPERPAPLDERLRELCREAGTKGLCGIDVGGTDIKLAVSDGERLICTKEYDWNPAAYPTAEEITGPIVWLTRLMRACLAASRVSVPEAVRAALSAALRKNAALDAVKDAAEQAEAVLGEEINVLDGVGLSFPDIVIHDRILGGETPKTGGMRRCADDYEREFAKLSALRDVLLGLCKPGGRVRIANDGSMAAFTAAAELAQAENAGELRNGVIAHSLGTDLGTGWLTAEGTIPPLPLEMYDAILDLGSYRSRAFPPEDLRSTRNENSGLPGARRYMGQAAAYRLAQKKDPALLEGFTAQEDGLLTVAAAPRDMRKACLEHLMQRAEGGDAAACAIFRDIGTALSAAAREMDFLLRPAARSRFLFGRFVKRPAVFRLLEEGFQKGAPGLRLLPSDEGLAYTPLMRSLADTPGVTVAQFGQAVGSIYFALT